MRIKVIHIGLGPIGNAVVRQCATAKQLEHAVSDIVASYQ